MPQKVAIIHDWFIGYTGAEKVVEQLLLLYPEADLISLVDFLPANQREFLRGREIKTSSLQHFPFARRHYRNYLWIMPLLIEQFDLSAYELVLSSCHTVAKGVITHPDQLHISYIYSPIRYAWDMQHEYLVSGRVNRGIRGWLARILLHYIRVWDLRTVNSIDDILACSQFIARRIWKIYRRESTVIYPPVDTTLFPLCEEKRDYYLIVSRLVEYKKITLIIEAFSQMPDKQLFIIGEGPKYKPLSRGLTPNIKLLGYQPAEVVSDYMQHARAFVYAAREDFGISILEAQACGTPVIAYDQGAVAETVRGLSSQKPTGILYQEQSVESIKSAIQLFEDSEARILQTACRENAERFSPARFRSEFSEFVNETWKQFSSSRTCLPVAEPG